MHERVSVNALCLFGKPLRQVAEFWRQLRPQRVSFTSPLLVGGFSPARTVVQDGGYAVETISHPFLMGHLDSGEDALLEARDNLSRTLGAAAALGARSVYVVTGGHGSLTWEEAAERFSRAIEPCVVEAQNAGIALAVENASPLRADVHIAHSLRDTLTLAEIAGIGICMDIHNCWTEAGLRQLIERAMPRCHLIQVSDYVYGDLSTPCRAVPGDGSIPLRRILDWALSAGYANGFDLELLGPRIDNEGHMEATRRAAHNVGELLGSLGA
jgi:sugar phosphate isomerase/epimerase